MGAAFPELPWHLGWIFLLEPTFRQSAVFLAAQSHCAIGGGHKEGPSEICHPQPSNVHMPGCLHVDQC